MFYGAAVGGVDAVDEVDGEVVLVRCPGEDFVPFSFQGIDDEVDAAENGRMWKDLQGSV